MTSLADRCIAALRTNHDALASLAQGLTEEQLSGPSGASEWTVAQVLSHLGSGAEIALAGLRATLAAEPAPAGDYNQGVWDRWNAMSPRAQADGFVEADTKLVATCEGLDADARANLTMQLAFLPFPLPAAGILGMRLNELVLHRWDAEVALDPAAALAADDAALLLELLAGDLAFMLGFMGHAEALAAPATIGLADSGFTLTVADAVSLSASQVASNATFGGPAEAAVRLIGGRLQPEHTPAGATVTGELTLADLRLVFPGV